MCGEGGGLQVKGKKKLCTEWVWKLDEIVLMVRGGGRGKGVPVKQASDGMNRCKCWPGARRQS